MKHFVLINTSVIFFLCQINQLAIAESTRDLISRKLTEGIKLFDNQDYAACEQVFREMMQLSDANAMDSFSIDSLGWLTRAYQAQKEFDIAESLCLKKLAELKKSNKRPHYTVRVLCLLASILERKGDTAHAEKKYAEALEVSDRKDCDSYYLVAPLVGLGTIAVKKKDYERGKDYWEQALKYTEGSNYDFSGTAGVVSGLSLIYDKLGQSDKNSELFQGVINRYKRNEMLDALSYARILQKYAMYMTRSEKWSSAEPLLQEADQIFQRHEKDSQEALDCHVLYMVALRKLGKNP